MTNLRDGRAPLDGRGACPHGITAPCIDVVRLGNAKKLRMHFCGLCMYRWWECNGTVLGLPEVLRMIATNKRLQPSSRVPAALMNIEAPSRSMSLTES
jgi:hypothetical protein